MEALLQNDLGVYYLCVIVAIVISMVLNVSKEKRIVQLRVAECYILIVSIALIVVIFEYAFSKVSSDFSKNLTELVNNHQIILLTTFGILSYVKLNLKINYSVASVSDKIKKSVLYKMCFDENMKLNEKGRVISKVAQNAAFTLIIWYLIVPIFWHYEIEIFYSSIITIFLAIVFLEIYFPLNAFVKKSEETSEKLKENDGWSLIKPKLRSSLKYTALEKRDNSNKTILNKEGSLQGNSSLICEVPNFEQFEEVNMNIMNNAFFENKKVLVICSSIINANEYYKKLNIFNKEYDGKILIKLLTEEDKIFDNSLDIYVSTLEICFGNTNLLKEIDTIIIEDIDIIMKNKVELLRAFGSIVKMGNPNVRYVILTYMLQGIEAAIKNLLLIEEITWYNTENKQQATQVTLNVWNKKNVDIGDVILGKVNCNIGNLIPLALLSTKNKIDRTLVISQDEPIDFQLNEINSIKNLAEKRVTNDEIDEMNQRLCLSKREKYFDYKANNYIVTNDNNYNLYDTIYKLSLINGENNQINIVSSQYLLRDYMIYNYEYNKSRLKQFLPYVPYEIDNSKVILHSLILQMTSFGVNQSVLVRMFNQNNIKITSPVKNNIRVISQALNRYIKRELGIVIDTYSYLILQDCEEKFIFDPDRNSFKESEPIYKLDKSIFKILPNGLFKEIRFAKDGFVLDICKEYSTNFYQKYLPGQRHALEGTIYKIKDIVEVDDEIDAIVEMSTDYDNNIYRQLRKINVISDINVLEKVKHNYKNIAMDYTLGKIGCEINTVGYYEFNNGVILIPNEYRYIELSDKIKEKVRRSYKDTKVLKIEIEKLPNCDPVIAELFEADKKDKLAHSLAFILSETLVSMLGENSNYIQVKPKVTENFDLNASTWIYPVVDINNNPESLEIYIFEDVELERGIIDIIYKNIDNILKIMDDYLEWVLYVDLLRENTDPQNFTYLKYIEPIMFNCGELKKILTEIVLKD